jgi:hypothetical protein
MSLSERRVVLDLMCLHTVTKAAAAAAFQPEQHRNDASSWTWAVKFVYIFVSAL